MNSIFNLKLHLLLCFLLTVSIYSQSQIRLKGFSLDRDSLFQTLNDLSDKDKIDALNLLAFSYSFGMADSCRYFAEMAYNRANDLKYKKGIAGAYRNYGHVDELKGNYESALKHYQNAYVIFEELDDTKSMGDVLLDIGHLNYYAQDYERCTDYFEQMLALARQAAKEGNPIIEQDKYLRLKALIGITYREFGQYERSIQYMKEYLNYADSTEIPPLELEMFLQCVGHNYYLLESYDSALIYYIKAQEVPNVDINVKALKMLNYGWLARIHKKRNEPEYIAGYLMKAYEEYSNIGNLRFASSSAKHLGNFLREQGSLEQALHYHQQAVKLAERMIENESMYADDSLSSITFMGSQLLRNFSKTDILSMILTTAISANKSLSDTYLVIGYTSEAFDHYIKYSEYLRERDKLIQDVEFEKLQTRFESDRQEHQIKLLSATNELNISRLKQNRYIFIAGGAMIIMILVVGFVLLRQNRLRNEQKAVVLEQKLLRSQMNPHFLFNSLASIQNFIVTEEPDKASIYLSKFSNLMRNILDNSVEEYVTLDKEVSTITNYLELQKVRYNNKFNFTIEIDPDIDEENMTIPPMLAQPFIENSIEHGIKHKKEHGNIHIRFTLKGNLIVFEVEDDGVGREKAKEIEYKHLKDHRSMATSITQERLNAINKRNRKSIKLEIIDLLNERGEGIGTKVIFGVPVA